MSISEFSIINEFFTGKQSFRDDVVVGIGDDAAITTIPPDCQLVTTVDTLVDGIHFDDKTSAFDLGFKSVAVNLSDLAAMGAEPVWATLVMSLPAPDTKWLSEFSEGLFTVLNQYQVQLVGGDTSKGPLTITLQLHGLIPQGKALLRNAAKPGDKIYVTGTLGDAGLGLMVKQGKLKLSVAHEQAVLKKLNQPIPRVEQGIALRGIANAAIDISDGLLGDLQHILQASQVGAKLYVDQLPLSIAMKSLDQSDESYTLPLNAGEDYELCFTVPESTLSALTDVFRNDQCSLSLVGEITADPGIVCINADEEELDIDSHSYNHFK